MPSLRDLFDKVVEILTPRKPEYLILENVPNLLRHDKERTWKDMRQGWRPPDT